jgi:hypothetical protein
MWTSTTRSLIEGRAASDSPSARCQYNNNHSRGDVPLSTETRVSDSGALGPGSRLARKRDATRVVGALRAMLSRS